MKAASGEFALAALLVVAGVLFAAFDRALVGGLICLCAVGLGCLGHRRGVLEIAKEKDLEVLASTERLQAPRPHVEVPQIAEEVKASGNAKGHWEVERGKDRQATTPPRNVDPFDYLLYRHTRSATVTPADPDLPPLRNFIDLREAALIPEDRATLVNLITDHIKRSFPQPEAYTGVLIPRCGNVALGLAVAEALGLQPVLVREEPLFGRSTESVLTAGLLILVDDVWSDGRILRRIVELARFDNYSVADAVLLVARSEGRVEADLEASHVTLKPLFRLSDEDIDSVLERVARGLDDDIPDGGPTTASL
jgi:orotate phosphoribosyltransferase